MQAEGWVFFCRGMCVGGWIAHQIEGCLGLSFEVQDLPSNQIGSKCMRCQRYGAASTAVRTAGQQLTAIYDLKAEISKKEKEIKEADDVSQQLYQKRNKLKSELEILRKRMERLK